jgi:uncharacterized membrane protein
MERRENRVGFTGREKNIHRLFKIIVSLKGLHALFEFASGVLILSLSTGTIASFLISLGERELDGSHRDLVARFLVGAGQRLQNGGRQFAGVYLLLHGIINMVIVIGLLTGRLWAFPVGSLAIALFMAYQVYRYTLTHTFALIVLTVYDAIILGLIWHEYEVLRRMMAPARRPPVLEGSKPGGSAAG